MSEDAIERNGVMDDEVRRASTRRIRRRGGQVVQVTLAMPIDGIRRVEVPVGSLDLPTPHENN